LTYLARPPRVQGQTNWGSFTYLRGFLVLSQRLDRTVSEARGASVVKEGFADSSTHGCCSVVDLRGLLVGSQRP
jgi:hypothetical protein